MKLFLIQIWGDIIVIRAPTREKAQEILAREQFRHIKPLPGEVAGRLVELETDGDAMIIYRELS